MNEEFNDSRLVTLYDALNPWAADNDFYLSLLRASDASVLDLGCGTGMLACVYARCGRAVVGIDRAASMLDVARARPYGDRVEWVEAQAQKYRSDRRFDLIVMTGHAFQFLLTDQDVQSALSTMRRHLSDRGRVAFETRNPLRHAWSEWTPESSLELIELDGLGKVDVWTTVESEDGELIRFSMHYRFRREEDTLVSVGTLRFLDRAALEEHLRCAGFHIEMLLGDWSGMPFSAESPEIVVVARP